MAHDRTCVNSTTIESSLPGMLKSVYCGHRISEHDSGGCCRVNRCPCSHVVLSPQDEFDPTEPKGPKSIP